MPAFNSVIVGEGPMTQNVAERVASSRIRQQIDFRGRADNIVDAMHAIDILVVPSVLDGRPNIIMEANACGVPVIASPVGGIPEMIEEGVNGLLAGPQDVERITRAFATWMADPTSLDNIRASSREKAVKSFGRQAMIERYAHVFRAS
jgi:glycosyltransferase involved in cell wall biosynthesis